MARLRAPCCLSLVAALASASAGDPGAGKAGAQDALSFGVYAHVRSTEVLKKLAPIVGYLTASVARRIELHIYPTYREAVDALAEGKVDFVRFGPVSYVLAKEKDPDVTALVAEDNQGRPGETIIAVSNRSGLLSLSDLKGRSFAFGDRHSTEGRYFAQAELQKAGLRASDLQRYEYLGRHDRVASAVASGKFDAGALRDTAFRRYGANGALRAIHRAPVPQKAWVMRDALDPELSARLRDGLLAISDPEVLSGIQRSGFRPVDDTLFERVHAAMEQARRFQGPP